MARIVRFYELGGPEVLKIEEINVTPPDQGEVQIRVKAIGLNRAEALFRAGKYLEHPQFPSTLGYEASGIIEKVDPSVTNFAVGDVVSIVPPLGLGKYGIYGEVVNVPAQYVVKHPSWLSFEEAAALWMQYLTAYGAIIDIAQLKTGDYLVIPAASSSVGLAAIQLARLVGATPIALTRTQEKKSALLAAGAAHVIVTQEENISEKILEITGGVGARVVFDPVGGKTVIELAKAMSSGGILFQYGALSMEPTPFPFSQALKKGLSMRGYVLFEIVMDSVRLEKAKKFILNALEAKQLKPLIAKTFAFDQIVEAHRYLESNQQMGKIIVTV